jgi:hypothetical protein
MKIDDSKTILVCPICKGENTHGRRASSVVTNPGEHRIDLMLYFDCENGHEFRLDFIQHEGETTVEFAASAAGDAADLFVRI